MSDLFTMLNVAAKALDAQRYALDVTGQNIANVNTPGYARRSVVFAEVPPYDPWSPGGGVDVAGVTAARAPLIEARLRFEQPASAREGSIADQLSVVEAGLGQPGASLDATLARFYNTYAALAQNPASSSSRQQVIIEGQSLARAFNGMSTRFDTAERAADRDVRGAVAQVNALAKQLADLNSSIVTAGPANSAAFLDQQSVVLSSLNDLASVGVITHENGTIDVTIGNGRALVVGPDVYSLSITSQPPNGFAQILTNGASGTTDITGELSGGAIGGLMHVRDTLVPGYKAQLDDLAYRMSTDVNGLTTSGFDLNGNPGAAFFTPLASATNAAALFSVNGAVAADNALVVASGTGSAGNNDIASAVGALQDSPMTGSTAKPVDAWSSLAFNVATDASTANLAKNSHDQVAQQLKNLRDQVSGVSIDEEAAMLVRFQRAYEANARFFQVAQQTLDILTSLVRT